MSNYNQAAEIENYLNIMKEHWPIQDAVVVDDGSTDGSDLIAEKCGFKVLRHDKNIGVGAAIRTAILWAKESGYDVLVVMSSNGKMIPAEISRLTQPIIQGEVDYVTGNRYMKNGKSPGLSAFRRVAIPLFSVFASLIVGQWFSDITCGFRAYKIDFLFEPDMDIFQSWLDKYELEYYIQYYAVKKKLRIANVPVTIKYSHLAAGRKSKIIPFVGWWSMIRPFVLLGLRIKK